MEEKSRFQRIEEKLDQLNEEKEKKPKEFKLPFKGRVSVGKARKNYITIMKINENGFCEFEKQPIMDQTVLVDGVPRLASGEHVIYWKKNPIIIQPSWTVEPYAPSEHYKSSLKDGSNSAGYRLLMNRMQLETIALKKKIGGMGITIFGIIIAVIIAIALFQG